MCIRDRSSIIGENPLNRPTNLFPIIAKVALGEFHELFIYGNDWPTKDGTCLRDYIHIMDLAEAHIAAIDFLENNDPQYISFNIGTGKGTSVLEIVHKFMEVNNVLIPYEFKDRRKGDPSCLIADNSKALKLLKWKPQKQLHNICVDLWKFVYKSN